MNKNGIIEILSQQVNNLTTFVKVLEDKQHAIIENDYDLLSDKMNKEEASIGAINRTEEKRLTLMMEVIEQNFSNPTKDLLNIRKFFEATVEAWTREEKNTMKLLISKLKDLTMQCDSLNDQNKYLIDNARIFIKEIISAVVHAQKRSIIDRKI